MAWGKQLIHALCSLGAGEHIIPPPPSSLDIKATRERRQWDLGRYLGTGWSHLAGKEKEGGDGDRALQAKVGDRPLLRQKSHRASALRNCLAESPKAMRDPAPHHPPSQGQHPRVLWEPSLRPVRCEGTKEAQKLQSISPKPVILTDKNSLAKLYRVSSTSRWGWGKKNKSAAEAEEEEFNISICSYPNKLRCICGSVREARRNETIK